MISAIDEALKKYGVLDNIKPCDPLVLFNNFLSQLKQDEKQYYIDLYEELKLSQPELPSDSNVVKIPMIRPSKNCKGILVEYLKELAYKVNENFFNTLIIFIRLYKDYMDLHGWDIIGNYRMITMEERNAIFTSIQDAEHIPEGSNDFLKNYLPKYWPNFDLSISVDITFHLCQWLKIKGYTHTTISPT